MKTIKFTARNKFAQEYLLPPVPASKYVPDWWLEAPAFIEEEGVPNSKKRIFSTGSHQPNHSFKKCTPMLDAMQTGYILKLWTDVWVNDSSNPKFEKEVVWKVRMESPMTKLSNEVGVFQKHGPTSEMVEKPVDMANGVWKYTPLLYIETPPGYSTLFVQPLGYRNLPFQAVPAVVDTDTPGIELVAPLWVRKDFTGVVERGTPILQAIPFKRDDWKMSYDYLEDGRNFIDEDVRFNLNIVNNYAKRQWKKKSFK